MALKIQPLTRGRRKDIGTSLSEINVTPFVDVMLVLLVIFMVTAPLMQSGIGVELPQAETDNAPADEGLILTITKDQYIHLGNSVIHIQLLENKLREYFHGRTKKIVFVQADKALDYGFFVDVLDIVKKVGVETVGLVTEPKEVRARKKGP
jgi:biopolymer transport protein TolR